MYSPTYIHPRRVLVIDGVNAIAFDNKYIVSVSVDRTLKMWLKSTCQFKRTLTGIHTILPVYSTEEI